MANATPFTDAELQVMSEDEIRYYALVDKISLDTVAGKQECINEFKRMAQLIADAGYTSGYMKDTARYEASKAAEIADIRRRR